MTAPFQIPIIVGRRLRTSSQPSLNKLRGATIGILVTLLTLAFGSSGITQAATIPFTFELTFDTFVVGIPSVITPTLPTTVLGSGSYSPFGSAIYSEAVPADAIVRA
jgi:hypothetical protein